MGNKFLPVILFCFSFVISACSNESTGGEPSASTGSLPTSGWAPSRSDFVNRWNNLIVDSHAIHDFTKNSAGRDVADIPGAMVIADADDYIVITHDPKAFLSLCKIGIQAAMGVTRDISDSLVSQYFEKARSLGVPDNTISNSMPIFIDYQGHQLFLMNSTGDELDCNILRSSPSAH